MRVGEFMTEYYFDIETRGLNPYKHKIISIQYQEIDTKTGASRFRLQILKEWESSEKEILKQFLKILDPNNVWNFIPIGFNLRFDLTFLQIRFKEILGVNLDYRWLHQELPLIDIKDTIVMVNDGRFKGATLNWFVRKEFDGSEVPRLYDKGEFEKIEYYVKDEAKRFIHAYQFLKKRLPKLYFLYDPLP